MTAPVVLLLVAFVPMILEAARSRSNERSLRSRGAIEPADDVYPFMQIAYPACFLAMAAEAWVRQANVGLLFAAGAAVFAAGKALKYWAIATLGWRWSFRVLVVPGAPLLHSGPYRWLRHPNYLGIAGELVGMALMAAAPVAGATSIVVFGALMLARIRVEERALEACAR